MLSEDTGPEDNTLTKLLNRADEPLLRVGVSMAELT